MEKQSIIHQQPFCNCLDWVMFLAVAAISFQCAENDPAQLAPGERPETVAWISVKTGLADTTYKPPKGVAPGEYIKILNGAGFKLSWAASKSAAYYEVRASRRIITTENWDRAYLAAKVPGGGDTIRAAIDRIQPSISGKNCTGCRLCVESCPRHAITIYKGKAVINLDSCIGCSRCFDKCTYSAVSDENLTKFYYFAVRAFSQDRVGAEEVTCTGKAYKSRYTNIAYLPSLAPWCGFCGKNCYILNPGMGKKVDVGACPVDAVYFDPNPDTIMPSLTGESGLPNLIHIDQSKCIACGLCVEQCGLNNGTWSVRREIISLDAVPQH